MGLLSHLWAGIIPGVAAVAVTLVVNLGIAVGGKEETVERVEEWEQAPATDLQMPPLTISQLLAELDKVAAAGEKLSLNHYLMCVRYLPILTRKS